MVAKTEGRLVRLRPTECYHENALYIENHTITGCDVFLQYDNETELCFGYDTQRKVFVQFKLEEL